MYAYDDTVVGACGLGNKYQFEVEQDYWGDRDLLTKKTDGGTGMFIAAFIPEPNCKAAYEELTAKRRIVFQSPVRRNNNSGNKFFFCVFDERDGAIAQKQCPSVEPNWPFK
jgi:hypothetical protein